MDKDKIIKELKKFKKKNKIDKMIFFGSRTNNKYTKYSDIDLIVISSKFKKIKSFKRAPVLRLKWELDYPVDLLCYTPEEFEKKKKEPTIVKEAVENGIEIQ
ncbi:nucleotidyltransferase domain-containing protein [Candidatus Woesearchaeota archaeon]|nr:nucleotidyltransferase domain-containing protein [Candidatus Woesearchaeota archaeon]